MKNIHKRLIDRYVNNNTRIFFITAVIIIFIIFTLNLRFPIGGAA